MKKHFAPWLIATIICNSAFSQKLVKTYWDYKKTQVQAEYYTDAYGTKNGSFKGFSQYGGILMQGTFKDGIKIGKWIENNEDGTPHKIETFNEKGENEGAFSGWINGVLARQGAYKNNERDGMWMFIDGTESSLVGQNYYRFTDAEKKSCACVKSNFLYKNDVAVFEGKIISTYYPSGKPFNEVNYDKGKAIGECISYLPNGKIFDYRKFDLTGVMIDNRKCDYPGCSMDSIGMIIKQTEAKLKKENEEKEKAIKEKNEATLKKNADDYKVSITHGDEAFTAKKYEDAKRQYEEAASLMPNEKYPVEKLKELDDIFKKIEGNRTMAANLNIDIDNKCKKFKSLYVGTKESSLFVDPQTGKPIVKETYPKGEYLYKKTDIILQPLLEDYKALTDADAKIEKGNYIVTFLNKLIELAETDTSGIDKQIKKAKSNNEVKTILGIQ